MQVFTANQAHQLFVNSLEAHFTEVEIDAMFWQYAEIKLGFNRLDYMKNQELVVNDMSTGAVSMDLQDLVAQKPIQYVTGKAYFMDLVLNVSPAVLIPRPETEELVLEVEKHLKHLPNPVVVDVCTGSGCIALAVKHLVPKSTVSALDISLEALEVARLNGEQNSLQVEFLKQDALNLAATENRYDAVISNPPYVLDSEKQEMKANVLEHEPHLALFVRDDDPLLFYNAISQWAFSALKPNGWLFFEINQKYGQQIVANLTQLGFKNARVKNDIFDKPRMVIAQK